jgi:hypothetical protein
MRKKSDNGQATVEVALLIPVLVLFLMLIIQVCLVIRGYVLAQNGAREAARVLTVENNRNKAQDAVHKNISGASVEISRPNTVGDYVNVTVKDTVKSTMPILGFVFPDVTVSATSSMRVEK